METSDSECFESADEEFYSDDENVCTVISDNKSDEKKNEDISKDNTHKSDANENPEKKSEQTINTKSQIQNSSQLTTVKDEISDSNKNIVLDSEVNIKVSNEPTINEKTDIQSSQKIHISKVKDEKGDCNKNVVKNIKSESATVCENEKNKNYIEESTIVIGDKETIDPKDEKLSDTNKPKQAKIIKEKLRSKVGKTELDLENNKKLTNEDKILNHEMPVCKLPDKNKLEMPSEINSLDSPELKQKVDVPSETNKSPVINDGPEENLWDDDEIDWGKEQELENLESDKKSVDDTNLWDVNDEWESVEHDEKETINKEKSITINKPPVSEKLESKPQNNSGWGSWGNWGVSSILNTATQSVSSLTSHVSQGITTVLESGIGVPDPEDLARQHKEDEAEIIKKMKDLNMEKVDDSQSNSLGGFGLGNLVSGVSQFTRLVESTGSKVITGGLDTLETIGKKTMEVLQEGDPGLKKKRAFLKLDQNKPILSQVLREAKEKADEENRKLEKKHIQRRAKNYETLFDDHQGLVHLEALEMLSKQCDIKLETLTEKCSGDALIEMQETLDQVKELCELPEEDEDEQLTVVEIKEKIETAVSEINITISYNKLMATWTDIETWLEELKLNIVDETELHQQAIESLAQLTAISVEQFHKAGELLLIKEHRSTADEADSLVQLTTSLIALIGIVAAKFSEKLNSKATSVKNKESVNELITNVFFEASNSSSYIQDAFQLLIPVLQVGAV